MRISAAGAFRPDHAAPGSGLIAIAAYQPFPVVERAPLGADRPSRGACRAAALELEARSDQARHLRVPPAAALTGRLPSTSLRVAAITAKEQPRCPTPAAPETRRVIAPQGRIRAFSSVRCGFIERLRWLRAFGIFCVAKLGIVCPYTIKRLAEAIDTSGGHVANDGGY
jgi:hypothetical protein